MSSSSLTGLYRRALRQVRLVTPEMRRNAILQALRNDFRKPARPLTSTDVDAITKSVTGKLRFIEMILPRQPGQQLSDKERPYRYVVRDGHVVAGSAYSRGSAAHKDNRITDEQIRHHYRLLDRQHFNR